MEKVICPNCESDKLSTKQIRHTSTYAGEEFEVLSPTLVCTKCDEQVMTSSQMNELRMALVDAYREKHELLTSKQIQGYRAQLKMSQREFAEYLSVGEASIKRWETYYAQEKAMDEHVRAKCDSKYAENNSKQVAEATAMANDFTGKKKFSYDRFKNTVLMLTATCKSPLYINKAVFYVDFLNFKRHGRSITGCQYTKLEHGPCPENYKDLFRRMQSDGVIQLKSDKAYDYKTLVKVDESVFDDQELETIKYVVSLTKTDNGKKIFKLSHEEKAFKEAEYLGPLDYSLAKFVKI